MDNSSVSLAKRSVRSVTWKSMTTLVLLPVNFAQSIVLARLLPIEYFGIFTAASSIIALSSTLFEFGLGSAFVHRSPETEDEQRAIANYFTLYLAFNTIWMLILLAYGWVALSGMAQLVLVILVGINYLSRWTNAPRMLLVRRVQHRRLALIDLVTGLSVAVCSMGIAWYSRSIWALLIASVLTSVWSFIGLYFWRPFWTPRLAWDPPVIRYLLKFGSRMLVNNVLDSSLDNVDNLWTGRYLGAMQLGYYSRAFKFATYPRMLLSTPVNVVAVGTYAELKYDRRRLSKAFFQTNYLLIRAGFLLAGWLAVIAPEFIRLLIGERWLPMLPTFRLMLVFALLDPVKVTIAGILMAVGRPEKITVVRFCQLLTLIVGLFLLGIPFQTSGVALAMDLMITVGIVLSLYFVRPYVDYSLSRLLLVPVISLLAGIGLVLAVVANTPGLMPDWLTLLVKSSLFIIGYLGILLALEWKRLVQSLEQFEDFRSIQRRFLSLW